MLYLKKENRWRKRTASQTETYSDEPYKSKLVGENRTQYLR